MDPRKVQTKCCWLGYSNFCSKMSNVFLNLPTLIDVSLPIIFQ
jgi:hypothetical protein